MSEPPKQDRRGNAPSPTTRVPPPVAPSPSPPPKESAPAPRALSTPSAPISGGIGHYQDRQEQQLRERIEGTAIQTVRTGDTIKLVLPSNLAFAANGDQLQPRLVDALNAIAPVLKEYSKTAIDIKGYTDSTGSFEHNQQLSGQRAQAVANLFISKQIPAARIRTAGFGPRYPVADNKTEAGRAQNRRIEISLVPAS